MTADDPYDHRNDAYWREYLTRGDPMERAGRRVFRRIPTDPRCRLCAAPFAGLGAPVMRLLGKQASDANPNLCAACFTNLRRHRGGAEIDATFLFADIRGSTALAETMSPAEFRGRVNRFYGVASGVVFDHDGAVDKFVGDEVVAMFFPLLAGDRHPHMAVKAARALLVATGHDAPAGPWIPVGAGVQTGPAWFGVVGDDTHVELTALGDTVNTTARLASAAAAGEVLVGLDAAVAAGLDVSADRRSLELKGKASPVEAISLRVGGPEAARVSR
jgi:adenylate cyclase